MKKTKNFLISHFSLLIVLIILLAYGIGITRLSFYGDDWIYIYNYHIAGPASFDLFQRSDRPHSAWVYLLTTFLFKESALAYHLFLLLLRGLSVFLFWQVLERAFGKHRSVYTAALLFAVYPGFQQQPIAVEFVMHFASLVLVLLSILLLQKYTVHEGKRSLPLLLMSLFFGGLSIFTCEYFIGLELTRPFFLYFTLKQQNKTHNNKETLKRSLLCLLPYLCVVCFYFIWRIFIFSFTSYAPKLLYALEENPVNGIRLLIEKVIQDLLTVLFRAYSLIFTRPVNIGIPAAAVVFLLTSLPIFFVLMKISRTGSFVHDDPEIKTADNYTSRNSEQTKATRTDLHLFLVGIALLVFSGIPYWGTFLDVSISFPWDRSTLSFSPGAAVVIAVMLDFMFKPLFSCIAASVLTALSVLFQIENTQIYIKEADKMNDYFWQLTWRMPGLEKGTILASENIPLDRTSDNDLSPIVNWTYAPENRGLVYDYKFFDLDLREGFFYTDPNQTIPVEHTYRSHSFSSSTDKTLGIFYRKNGCLQIIDQNNTGYPELPESLIRISGISDPGLIITDPEKTTTPPAAIGQEPAHGYCYHFQKTTLALQKKDQNAAYQAALAVIQNDVHPTYASDLAPVVTALLNESDYENAESILQNNQIGSSDWKYLCEYWKKNVDTGIENRPLEDFYMEHECF
ncbi:MAG: glycosyltransferase family 39 protein [Anaerolineaceae bacterium]|nr:glycosyltransferase family 39 protein [Anaerolineaceae bacterium]